MRLQIWQFDVDQVLRLLGAATMMAGPGGFVSIGVTEHDAFRIRADRGGNNYMEETTPCDGVGQPLVNQSMFLSENLTKAVGEVLEHDPDMIEVELRDEDLSGALRLSALNLDMETLHQVVVQPVKVLLPIRKTGVKSWATL
jgi:hypothetical protein